MNKQLTIAEMRKIANSSPNPSVTFDKLWAQNQALIAESHKPTVQADVIIDITPTPAVKKSTRINQPAVETKTPTDGLARKVGDMEAERLGETKTRILNALKAAGKKGCTNKDLVKIALRYGARIHELQKNGWAIIKQHVGGGLFLYTLDCDHSTTLEML